MENKIEALQFGQASGLRKNHSHWLGISGEISATVGLEETFGMVSRQGKVLRSVVLAADHHPRVMAD